MLETATKIHGKQLCEMDVDELSVFLSKVAEKGAFKALEHVGLHDESAGEDVRDLRELMKGWRIMKKNAWSSLWNQFWKIVSAIMTLLLIGYLFGNNQHMKDVLKIVSQGG